jgi:hypothetical protein
VLHLQYVGDWHLADVAVTTPGLRHRMMATTTRLPQGCFRLGLGIERDQSLDACGGTRAGGKLGVMAPS